MDKKEIRRNIKMLFAEHSDELDEKSKLICKSITASSYFQNADTILAYMPLPDEVNILPVIQNALADSKTVFLPHIFPETNKMEFYNLPSTNQTTTGEYGITEPVIDSNSRSFDVNSQLSKNILVLVPGRAFTTDGNRLGRGKGFYDIYFENKKIHNLTLAGVCFAFQIVDYLPITKNDIKMDTIFVK